MKFSVLDKFLNGTLMEERTSPTPLSPEKQKAIDHAYEALWNSCSDEQQELFRNYEKAVCEIIWAEGCFNFKFGFSCGLLLAMEAVFTQELDEKD